MTRKKEKANENDTRIEALVAHAGAENPCSRIQSCTQTGIFLHIFGPTGLRVVSFKRKKTSRITHGTRVTNGTHAPS